MMDQRGGRQAADGSGPRGRACCCWVDEGKAGEDVELMAEVLQCGGPKGFDEIGGGESFVAACWLDPRVELRVRCSSRTSERALRWRPGRWDRAYRANGPDDLGIAHAGTATPIRCRVDLASG